MVAQRKAISTTRTTPRRRVVAVGQPQQMASDCGEDGDPSRELLALQAMRADALSWLADIERRIVELEQAMPPRESGGSRTRKVCS